MSEQLPEIDTLKSIDRRLKSINGSLNVVGLLIIISILLRSCA